MRIFILLLALSFLGCNDEGAEICAECSQNSQVSSFEDKLFRFSRDSIDAFIRFRDSISGRRISYRLCFTSGNQNLDINKIIIASGSLHKSCNPLSIKDALISDFEFVDTCPDPIPNIAGDFTLENRWFFDHLIYKGIKIYLPCESTFEDMSPDFVITKSNNSTYFVAGYVANNSFGLSFKISSDTIIFSELFGITQNVGTKSERDFEQKYFEGISPNLKVVFNTSNNLLQLNNFEHNIIYKYYTK